MDGVRPVGAAGLRSARMGVAASMGRPTQAILGTLSDPKRPATNSGQIRSIVKVGMTCVADLRAVTEFTVSRYVPVIESPVSHRKNPGDQFSSNRCPPECQT